MYFFATADGQIARTANVPERSDRIGKMPIIKMISVLPDIRANKRPCILHDEAATMRGKKEKDEKSTRILQNELPSQQKLLQNKQNNRKGLQV